MSSDALRIAIRMITMIDEGYELEFHASSVGDGVHDWRVTWRLPECATCDRPPGSCPGYVAPTGSLRIHDIELNVETRDARRGTERIPLTHAEFEILAHLARCTGKVVRPEELLLSAGIDRYTAHDAREACKVFVHRLRRKLGDDPKAPRYIANVRGHGYLVEESSE